MRVVLIPGMGCTPVATSNWYSWFASEMRKRSYVDTVILRDFPDPYECKESVWVPFLTKEIGLDESTVVVGHSSGAAGAMRLLESDDCPKLLGAVLVAAAYTYGIRPTADGRRAGFHRIRSVEFYVNHIQKSDAHDPTERIRI